MSKNPTLLAKQFLFFAIFYYSPVWSDENPDLLLETDGGYNLHIHSRLQPLAINQIHSWLLELKDESGAVTAASISVVGGMPEHDHGLPPQPQLPEEVEPGSYLIEGIRFHMPGKWQMQFSIQVNGIVTNALLEFQL